MDPDIASLAARLGMKGLAYTSFARPLRRAVPATARAAAPPAHEIEAPRIAAPPPLRLANTSRPVDAAAFPLISEALAVARGAPVAVLPSAARPFAGLAAAIAARRAAGE